MNVSGSFKIAPWSFIAHRGIKQLKGEAILRMQYVYLRAVLDYLQEVIELVPVLTGRTKKQFIELYTYIQERLREVDSRSTSSEFYMEIPESNLDLTPTARQHPGSLNKPLSPDPGKTYKSGKFYRGRMYMSRGAWRAAAKRYTRGSNTHDLSFKGTNQYSGRFNFMFSVTLRDQIKTAEVGHYYPEVYKTLGAAEHVFQESLAAYYPRGLQDLEKFLIAEGKT